MKRQRLFLPLLTAFSIGGEFKVDVPKGWDADDQWYRQVPFAEFAAPGEARDPRMSVERYRRDDPLGLTPADLISALGDEGGGSPRTAKRKAGKKEFTVYEVARRPGLPRAAHADEYADVLGPGKPGIRSKIERCRGRGAYRLPEAYNQAREDKARLELFQKVHLGYAKQRRLILACLGQEALSAVEFGAPLPPLSEPSEAQIVSAEEAERAADPPEELQAASIVEAKDRFYVLRFTASTGTYRAGLKDFDAFLSSFKILGK